VKKVVVNGRTLETAAGNIAALIAELGFANGTVLVEHNGTALRPAEWSQRAIREGDRFELLRIAAGG
jgi:thiamine biosynthesis protein ThiS